MARRVALILALVCGIFWVAGTLVLSYPDKFRGGERMTDAWRPVFTDDGLAQARTDIDAFSGFANQFSAETVPALATQLGMTAAQFGEFVQANFPDTAAGLGSLDEIVPYFDGVVGGLEANQDEFRLADAIPTKNLPATTVPWIFIGLGVIVIGVAAAGLARPARAPIALAGAGALGLVAILGSLVLSVPNKAQAVEDTTDDFRTTFSTQGVALARQHMDTVTAFAADVTDGAVPAIATALETTPGALVTGLSTQFPQVGAVLADLPGMLARFDGLVTTLEATSDDFKLLDSVPTKGSQTTLLEAQFAVPGALLVLAGALGLMVPALARRRRPVTTEALAV